MRQIGDALPTIPVVTSLDQLLPGQAAVIDDGANPLRWVRRRLDGSVPQSQLEVREEAITAEMAQQGGRIGALETPLMRGRNLEGFKWYRAFRINNIPNEPDSPGEGTSVVFEITGQSDFGNTANSQVSRIFASFGVRGGNIAPVFTVWGGRRLSSAGASMGFRVYKNADGYYWLYIRTAVYSLSSIRYYITNYAPGVSDPLEATDTITHDGANWVIPKPTGSGELVWDYDIAEAFQPVVVGKGYALTSTDRAGLMMAGFSGSANLLANVPMRFNTERVIYDPTGRRQGDQSYLPLGTSRGNGELGPGVYHYTLSILILGGVAGAGITVIPQRLNADALYAHRAILRGGSEHLSFSGTLPLESWQNLWFDLSCDQDVAFDANTMVSIHRGYGQ